VRNLEVDFLIVAVPTTYNVILGWPALHKVKAIIALYLLQLQYEADDGSVGKLQRDQYTAREGYLVIILPLVECSSRRGPVEPLPADKRWQVTLPPPAKALAICTLTSADTKRPHPEPIDGLEGGNQASFIQPP